MKNEKAFCAGIVCCLICLFATKAEAQETTLRLNNSDVSITLKTQKIAPNSSGTHKLINNLYTQMYLVKGSNRTIPRIIADPESGLYFGYDLEVGSDLVSQKITLSVKPLSIKPIMEKPLKDLALRSLPNYPDTLVVEDGDTVILDILEDPRTRVRIVDTITVRVVPRIPTTPETKQESSSVGPPLQDFTTETFQTMKLTDVKMFVNGTQVANLGGLSGPVMYFYIPERGQFIFSLSPHKGYGFQRIGILEGNEISFTANGVIYRLVSSSPILAANGSWNLWVLHNPNFRPDARFAAYSPYWMGTAERVEDLLERKE